MGYRGDDLDLRTPQTWAATPGDLAGGSQGDGLNGIRGRGAGYGGRAGPIWVDDTVLASCNHAFDVALAHRAGEVRIEHLLHALTRIDAAAETLENRGVRVAALRRQTATVIASEIPVAMGGQAAPRRSDALEEALRLAAAQAYRRNAPAGVDDLLHVLLDVKPDLPGVHLLSRAAAARLSADVAEPPMASAPRTVYEPQPQMTPQYAPQYAPQYNPAPTYVAPQPTYVPVTRAAPQPAYYDPPPRQPARPALAATTADTIQNSRLDALEQMVRALGADLTSERQTFSGMLQDLQRDVVAGRGDDRGSAALLDRLASVEGGIESRLSDLSRSWSTISDRLNNLERAFDRMDGLERSLAGGLKSFEAQLASGRTEVDLSPLAGRLDIIEEALLNQDAIGGREIDERVRSLETGVAGVRNHVSEVAASVNGELRGLTSALASQANAASGVQNMIQERIQALTSAIDRQTRDLAQALAGPLNERVERIALLTEQRGSEQTDVIAQLVQRLVALEQHVTTNGKQVHDTQLAFTQELGEVHDALVKLNTNQHTLAGSIDQWRLDGQGDMSVIANRLQGVEREVSRPVQMLEGLSASIDGMNRVFVERHHRRNRFWYWLFGTDDWVAASWPSQLARIEDERRVLAAGGKPATTR